MMLAIRVPAQGVMSMAPTSCWIQGSARGDSIWLFSTSGSLDEVLAAGGAAPEEPDTDH